MIALIKIDFCTSYFNDFPISQHQSVQVVDTRVQLSLLTKEIIFINQFKVRCNSARLDGPFGHTWARMIVMLCEETVTLV